MDNDVIYIQYVICHLNFVIDHFDRKQPADKYDTDAAAYMQLNDVLTMDQYILTCNDLFKQVYSVIESGVVLENNKVIRILNLNRIEEARAILLDFLGTRTARNLQT